MHVDIIRKPLSLTLYGKSGQIVDQNVSATGKQLMDAMWQEIGAKGLKHKGVNHWVYEDNHMLFVGVELEENTHTAFDLECKKITISDYAYLKYIGPYSELPKCQAEMREYLKSKGLATHSPEIEIYGHWTEDQAKLETEIIIALQT